jgi:hypothetical protein
VTVIIPPCSEERSSTISIVSIVMISILRCELRTILIVQGVASATYIKLLQTRHVFTDTKHMKISCNWREGRKWLFLFAVRNNILAQNICIHIMDQSPINQNFDLNYSRQNFITAWKSNHKISNIPKFRCKML